MWPFGPQSKSDLSCLLGALQVEEKHAKEGLYKKPQPNLAAAMTGSTAAGLQSLAPRLMKRPPRDGLVGFLEALHGRWYVVDGIW